MSTRVHGMRGVAGGLTLVGVLTAVLLVGCDRDSETAEAAPNEQTPPAVVVQVEPVRPETFREVVRGVGSLRAQKVVEVSPEISGTIVDIAFQEGQRVQEGDVLVQLDDSKLLSQLKATQAALERARSQMEYARKTYQRFQELVAGGAATQDRLDQAQTDLQSAASEVDRLTAEVSLLQERLDDATIQAPLNGVVGTRLVDVGDYVQEGQQLTTIYTLGTMEIVFHVPERYIGTVQTQQLVDIRIDAYPDRTFDGEITYISPSVDERTRNLLIKAAVDNDEGLLKSGAFATAVVTTGMRENRPSVPESALVATTQGYRVYVVEDGTARIRQVTVGLREAGRAEVRDGVQIGERVVTEGHMRLSGGEPVEIEDNPTTGEPAGEPAPPAGA